MLTINLIKVVVLIVKGSESLMAANSKPAQVYSDVFILSFLSASRAHLNVFNALMPSFLVFYAELTVLRLKDLFGSWSYFVVVHFIFNVL